MAVSASELARELEELIAAIDRRVPRLDRAGEAAIVREAAALRAKAVERLEELARYPTPAMVNRVDPTASEGTPQNEQRRTKNLE